MEDIKILQSKLQENPDDLETLENYAIALSDIGENEEALKNFLYLPTTTMGCLSTLSSQS